MDYSDIPHEINKAWFPLLILPAAEEFIHHRFSVKSRIDWNNCSVSPLSPQHASPVRPGYTGFDITLHGVMATSTNHGFDNILEGFVAHVIVEVSGGAPGDNRMAQIINCHVG